MIITSCLVAINAVISDFAVYGIGKNWLNPPSVTMKTKGVTFVDYDENQKAFLLEATGDVSKLDFRFSGSEEDVIHPVLIVKNVSRNVKTVRVGKERLNVDAFKSGSASRNKQTETVIWLGKDISCGTPITIEFEK